MAISNDVKDGDFASYVERLSAESYARMLQEQAKAKRADQDIFNQDKGLVQTDKPYKLSKRIRKQIKAQAKEENICETPLRKPQNK